MEKGPKVSPTATNGGAKAALDSGRLLRRAFFELPPEVVAPRLLGKVLAVSQPPVARSSRPQQRPLLASGRIVEVEAYLGPHSPQPDPAAHAHRGPTPRNAVIFGPAGHAYVYLIYGRYFCMNIVCEIAGRAGCILIRALEPLAGLEFMAAHRGLTPTATPAQLTSGPSRLCQALGLTRMAHNGLDLLSRSSPLQVLDDGFAVSEVLVTPRIGLTVAVDRPLRFAIPGHPCVSGPKLKPGLNYPWAKAIRMTHLAESPGRAPA